MHTKKGVPYMVNAKDELLDTLEDIGAVKVKCAHMYFRKSRYDREKRIFIKENYTEEDYTYFFLKLNYTEADYEKFFNELDFDYYGYGGEMTLFGTVWLEDNSWLSRIQYGTTEDWQHNVLPTIPVECM